MLTPQQESNLTSGGDCADHWHSIDRLRSHADLLALQQLAEVRTVATDVPANYSWDYLLVDTTAGNVTVSMPRAQNGRELEVIKISTSGSVIVEPYNSETINGEPDMVITEQYTSIRLKAIPNGWVAI